MWGALMDWLPDLAAGTVEVRDLANILVGGLGVYLAWLAIRMGREQDAVTAKQMELMEGQRGLLAELKALEAKQAEIAEAQHRVTVDERARKVVLTVVRPEGSSSWDDPATHRLEHFIYAENLGDLVTREVHWKVRVPSYVVGVSLYPVEGNTVLRHGDTFDVVDEANQEVAEYVELSARYDGPVYPMQQVRLARVLQLLPHPIKPGDKLDELEWSLECAQGRFPPLGFGSLWIGFGKRPGSAGGPADNS